MAAEKMTDALQAQIEDLQSRLVFQEELIHNLNDVVAGQDALLQKMQAQMRVLGKRFDDHLYSQDSGGAKPADERPPHY
ncbi:SlyX family protein [Marinimicrobium alkaliphilum]|uniref:SlyX family protein n=1 Tax=Marinimicrobium alkaliphilum TaxID=2202654 RepID=UPI000DB95B93|nr:SlyX family protein [Marinimicrobium alkaliphilum]